MPLEEGLLIAVKDGVVELTASLVDPHADSAQAFVAAVNERIFEHQYQAMTDPTILDPDNLALATCVVSRSPIPEPLKDGLISLGFTPVETEGGGREDRSMFARFSRNKRSTLDKWKTGYVRPQDASATLGSFEECLIEDTPRGEYVDILAEGGQAVVDASRTCFRQLIAPGLESLGALERHILQERSQVRGRMVFHSAAVRALTSFVVQTLVTEAPDTSWSDAEDADGALLVRGPGGHDVATDPEFRVVKFVVRGSKALLSSYVETVLEQCRA